MEQGILIFAGAGASKAVSVKHYPSTVEFYDTLPDQVTSDPIFAQVKGYLARVHKDGVVDEEKKGSGSFFAPFLLWPVFVLLPDVSTF